MEFFFSPPSPPPLGGLLPPIRKIRRPFFPPPPPQRNDRMALAGFRIRGHLGASPFFLFFLPFFSLPSRDGGWRTFWGLVSNFTSPIPLPPLRLHSKRKAVHPERDVLFYSPPSSPSFPLKKKDRRFELSSGRDRFLMAISCSCSWSTTPLSLFFPSLSPPPPLRARWEGRTSVLGVDRKKGVSGGVPIVFLCPPSPKKKVRNSVYYFFPSPPFPPPLIPPGNGARADG